MNRLELPIRAAVETARAHGIEPDRCDILQDASTLVLRLTNSLVARIVQDTDGPRKGLAWFARENAIALHLTRSGAPVISLHDGLPPGPHEHLGYPLNFWRFVSRIESPAEPEEIGRTLRQCHDILRDFPQPLEPLAILTECTGVLDMVAQRNLLALPEIELLRERLRTSTNALRDLPAQPLHGDAHMGNLMNTTAGLLWTDWEDAFSGPVEWDLASIIWNAKILDEDHATVESILGAYRAAGGAWDEEALHQSIIARGAVMTAWYPVLYPNPNEERRSRLKRRLEWLASV
jgi:hypothetical protein